MARVSQVEKANQEGRLGGGGGGEGQHLVGCQQGRGPVQEAGSCQGQSWVGSVCLVVGGGGLCGPMLGPPRVVWGSRVSGPVSGWFGTLTAHFEETHGRGWGREGGRAARGDCDCDLGSSLGGGLHVGGFWTLRAEGRVRRCCWTWDVTGGGRRGRKDSTLDTAPCGARVPGLAGSGLIYWTVGRVRGFAGAFAPDALAGPGHPASRPPSLTLPVDKQLAAQGPP